MLQTYKAKLNGDKIEWQDEKPEISSNGKSVEIIVTILEEVKSFEDMRPFGLGKGDFITPDDFDAPLPDEILADFEVK